MCFCWWHQDIAEVLDRWGVVVLVCMGEGSGNGDQSINTITNKILIHTDSRCLHGTFIITDHVYKLVSNCLFSSSCNHNVYICMALPYIYSYSGPSLSGHSQRRPPSLMWPTFFLATATTMDAFSSPSHQRPPTSLMWPHFIGKQGSHYSICMPNKRSVHLYMT